ncbi:LOW QUALITY PROTEIN: nuclear transcription factor Y subunit gamma [Lethenteron reissneri]|uniref:LOW QUALITY PROTEIN: nuclear transcription factor Y subunit gamma n=1 Tax=Lethenteron reissneri TaxID=7753 RepID=UPI002AB5EA4A|nr:LOW QUALITY PROTEIN: nuclear transcription factor Y subunit gamma [Lethenteron reissneri]
MSNSSDAAYSPGGGQGGGGGSGTDAHLLLQNFWPRVMEEIRTMNTVSRAKENDFKIQELPLARIKKIMKMDEDVKMISAEAPVLFAKAAQIFISELSLRAWIHTEDNKRRTLQRNDIAMAISKFDQFDFLIDIVPRDELKPAKRQEEVRQAVMAPEQVQYYFTLAQQPTAGQQGAQQGGQQQTAGGQQAIQPNIIIAQQPQGQVVQGGAQLQSIQAVTQAQAATISSTPVTVQVADGQQLQIVSSHQGQVGTGGQVQTGTVCQAGTTTTATTGQTMQVMQQIITNTGEIQHIPVQLNTGQLQYIRLAQPMSGGQMVQGQVQAITTPTGQQQLYQIQQVILPSGPEQQVFIQQAGETQQVAVEQVPQ